MFFLGQKIICPFCLTEIRCRKAPTNCPICKESLPVQYTLDYDQHPPFFTQVFGWPKVGKTVFLDAMTLMLVKMTNVWPNYAPAAATDLSHERIREIRNYVATGKVPDSTTPGDKRVYIMLLNQMERWGSRALVTRDYAGEIFETMNISPRDAPYLVNAPTTFMMIGPEEDESNRNGYSMDQLLINYINTLMTQGVNFAKERRKLVVVLTKADKIAHLPIPLRHYLEDDPLWAAVNTLGTTEQMDVYAMQAYIETMARVSNAICDWVQLSDSGKTFLRLAKDKKIDLRFSLISSTGDAVGQDGKMVSKWAPRRVLDPYFWALELQSSR